MGYRRYCQKCKAPFYDKFSDPIVCPSCEHSVAAFRFTQLKSSRLASGFYDEEKMDEVEDEDEDEDEEGEEDIADVGAEGEDDILLIPSEDEEDAIVPPNGAAGEGEGLTGEGREGR